MYFPRGFHWGEICKLRLETLAGCRQVRVERREGSRSVTEHMESRQYTACQGCDSNVIGAQTAGMWLWFAQQEVGREVVGVRRGGKGDRESKGKIRLWKDYAKNAYLFFSYGDPPKGRSGGNKPGISVSPWNTLRLPFHSFKWHAVVINN